MVSPLTAQGHPTPHSATTDDAALVRAERRKQRRYLELNGSPYGRLVVLGCEVSRRWNQEALRFVANCAKLKARSAPALLRASARAAWHARWWGLLSVAAQSALAVTLSGEGTLALGGPAGADEVHLADAFSFADVGPSVSRLPLR